MSEMRLPGRALGSRCRVRGGLQGSRNRVSLWETGVAHRFSPLVTIWPIVLGNSRLIQSLALGRHCFPHTYGQTRNAYSCAGEFPGWKPMATKHKYSLCYSSASQGKRTSFSQQHWECDSCFFSFLNAPKNCTPHFGICVWMYDVSGLCAYTQTCRGQRLMLVSSPEALHLSFFLF